MLSHRFLRTRFLAAGLLAAGSAPLSLAATLTSNTRAVVPSEVQQIISVDYRKLNDSPTGRALKERVIPDTLKKFETALKSAGIGEGDIEQLTFVAFRDQGKLRLLGIAQGQFALQKVAKRLKTQKVKPEKVRNQLTYPLAGGMSFTMLDGYTMIFGEPSVVKISLETRDSERPSLLSNERLNEMVQSIDQGAIWSVLDADGTQHALKSALGEASKLADYETIKKRMLASNYTMDFNNGVTFDMNVLTSDALTASLLSSVMKAGMMFKKVAGSDVEKQTVESMTVDSSASQLKLGFKTDDKKFNALLQSDLFTSVSR